MKSRLAWLWCGLVMLGGCSIWGPLAVRSQSPDDTQPGESQTRLVGDLAVPFGAFPVYVEAVGGLVTGLQGTGSDPCPSPQRVAVLNDMQTRRVANPNRIMASDGTSLVLVRGVLRPGIQKGDRFDIDVRIPSQSKTTSLRGGWMMETRLTELAVLNGRIREGHLLALAKGPIMVDPSAEQRHDRAMLGRGRILGGGVALKSRPLGLVLKPDHQNVFNSSRIAYAVNRRFHTFRKGIKAGAARAKTDNFIQLTVHPRYKDNIARYVRVVRAVALQDSANERMQRIASLTSRLLDPVTSADAAIALEAIGPQGVDALLQGIRAKDPEVRFYSAEALAYLDRREAAEPLGEAARRVPAFRIFALTALSAMDDFTAYEQLQNLLTVPSAETRYGAFRALWAMNPNDALVLGEQLGGQFSYHVLGTAGPPMIHVTRARRAEIVLFGQQQQLRTPLAVNAGNRIMVTSNEAGQISVSNFSVKKADQKRLVATQVDAVIRAIVELGGTYPDVVQALQEAKAAGALPSRFEVDALPRAGRPYDRVAKEGSGFGVQGSGLSMPKRLDNAVPELFATTGGADPDRSGQSDAKSKNTKNSTPNHPKSDKQPHPLRSFFAKMIGRDSD